MVEYINEGQMETAISQAPTLEATVRWFSSSGTAYRESKFHVF